MDEYQKELLKILEKKFIENPDAAEKFDIDKFILGASEDAAKLIKEFLINDADKVLREHRELAQGFVERNKERWGKAFDILETHILLCTEAGEEFNKLNRPKAVEDRNLVFDLVVRHHARACHIAQEILCLLQNGFADAAHARWRALHEVTVTAMFIAKHGQECAERFYFHDIVDSYDGMAMHKKYEDRLNEKAPSQDEIDECKKQYDGLLQHYGKKIGDHYGWASHVFPNRGRVTFTAIEKDVKLDHMRPYYKWASQNIHAGSKGTNNRLGLCEAKQDVLLVGQSNSGMVDPAHTATISLSQITSTLLMLEPTFDNVVLMKIISDFSNEVGEIFLITEKETLRNKNAGHSDNNG